MKGHNPKLKVAVVAGATLVASVVAGVMYFVWQLPDRDLSEQLYQRLFRKYSIPDEGGDAVVRGEVSHSGLGCENGLENCYFILQLDDVSMYVFYWHTDKTSCLNVEAATQGEGIRNGDLVEVFGNHYSRGSISVCDSRQYYIRRLR